MNKSDQRCTIVGLEKLWLEPAKKVLNPDGLEAVMKGVKNIDENDAEDFEEEFEGEEAKNRPKQRKLEVADKMKARAMEGLDKTVPFATSTEVKIPTEEELVEMHSKTTEIWAELMKSDTMGGTLKEMIDVLNEVQKLTTVIERRNTDIAEQQEIIVYAQMDFENAELASEAQKRSAEHAEAYLEEELQRKKRLRSDNQAELESQTAKRESYVYRNWGLAARMGMYDRDIDLADKRIAQLPDEIQKLDEDIASLEKSLLGNLQDAAVLQAEAEKKTASAKKEQAEQKVKTLTEGSSGAQVFVRPPLAELLTPEYVAGNSLLQLSEWRNEYLGKLDELVQANGGDIEHAKQMKTVLHVMSGVAKNADDKLTNGNPISEIQILRMQLRDARADLSGARYPKSVMSGLAKISEMIEGKRSKPFATFVAAIDTSSVKEICSGSHSTAAVTDQAPGQEAVAVD